MTELIIISIASFVTSLLTFFSGFGLGTILMPVFAIFFPVELAIALTGVVHFLNNIFKLSLVGLKADKQVVMRFGIPAFIAAFAGAWLLLRMTDLRPLYEYAMGDRVFTVTPLKLVIAVFLIFFTIMEVVPFFKNAHLAQDNLVFGESSADFSGDFRGIRGR